MARGAAAPLSPAEFRTALATGALAPVYLLAGEDEAGKSELAIQLGETVEAGLRAFNVERLYGDETDPATVVESARTFPMMAPRRIVVVLRAERLLNPKARSRDPSAGAGGDDDDRGGDRLEPLIHYLQAPADTTTLAFLVAGELPTVRRITKALMKVAVVVDCSGLDGTRDPRQWVEAQARAAGLAADPDAIDALVGAAAGDLAKLRGDTGRVLLFAAGRSRLTLADVREVVVAADVSEGAWDLTNAIERGDAAEALRELARRLAAGEVVYPILGQIRWALAANARSRYPAQKLPAAVDALLRTDLALKSSGDPRVALERLIVELCGR